MATFVQMCEEDPALDLVLLVVSAKHKPSEEKNAQKEKELNQYNQLVNAQKYDQVIERVVLSSMDHILQASANEINTVFNITFSLLPTLTPEQARKMIVQLVDALTKDKNHAVLKLKLLSTLFNLTDSSLRYSVFMSIANYSLDTDNSSILVDQLTNLEDSLSDWNLSDDQTAEVYRLLAKISNVNQKSDLEQKYLHRYFKLLENASAATLNKSKDTAVSAVVSALYSSDVSFSDSFLKASAVRNLQNDTKTAPLYQLLHIMVHDNLRAYSKFYSENKQNYDAFGLNHEKLLKKIQALTISSLGHSRRVISYDALLQELELKEDSDVESAVVEAVIGGVIDARIEQDRRLVHIQRTTVRAFDEKTWASIAQKLATWKRNVAAVKINVNTILSQLHQQQQQQQQQQQPQQQ